MLTQEFISFHKLGLYSKKEIWCYINTIQIKLFLLDDMIAIPVIFYKRCMKPKEKWAVVIVFRKILKRHGLKNDYFFHSKTDTKN